MPNRPEDVPPDDGPAKDDKASGRFWLLIAAVVVAVAALVIFLVNRFPGALGNEGARIGLVYQLGWLVLLVSGAIAAWRTRPGMALRHLAWWLVIAGVVAGFYAYRHELTAVGDRLMAELVPGQGRPVADGRGMVFIAAADGHFYIEATVEGEPIRFLVDTGASVTALSPADARRLGFDLDALDYTVRTQTANGSTWNAPVTLRTVAVGLATVHDLRALVTRSDLQTSLLGVNFLERFSRYEIAGDRLTLYR